MYNPYVSGERVYLRHPTIEDAEGPWHEWFSDESLTRWLALRSLPNSLEKQKVFLEKLEGQESRLVLSIVDIATDKHIGICNLSEINWVHRHCDIAIVMGDRDFQKGTHTLEAMSLLLRTAFLRLNMRNIISTFVETNEPSKAINKVFGFEQVGRMPKMFWDHGRYVDVVISVLDFQTWARKNRFE